MSRSTIHRVKVRTGVHLEFPRRLPAWLDSIGKGPNFIELMLEVRIRILVVLGGALQFEIPAGFRWDGNSRPWWADWMIPRVGPGVITPSLIHDWFYRHRQIDRRLADGLYFAALIACEVRPWRAWIAWAGVRLGGWRAWQIRSGQLTQHEDLYP